MNRKWSDQWYYRSAVNWQKSSRRRKIGVYVGIYTLLFLVTFLFAFSPFLDGHYSFIMQPDGRSQHFPTLVYIGKYFREVFQSLFSGSPAFPMFDRNIGLGEDVITTLNYYGFGDPLVLLSAFVPMKSAEFFYDFLAIFRAWLAGLTFSVLCVYHKNRVSYTLIGALMYAFSGFVIVYAIMHPYFINPVLQLPLLLVGCDMILKKKKPFVFILTVCYSALCGFYFLYMMTILVGIYTLVRFFEVYTSDRVKEFLQMAVRMLGSYLLGLGMAAVTFLPSVYAFLFSNRSDMHTTSNLFSYGKSYYRTILPKWIAPSTAENQGISLAAIALLALVVLICTRKKYRNLKIFFGIGLAIHLLPLGGYIFNGFGYPTQRWSFSFVLLLCYITVVMLPVLLNMSQRQKLICFAALLVYSVPIFCNSKIRTVYYIVGVAMLAVSLVVLLLFENGTQGLSAKQRKVLKNTGAVACVLLVMGNVSINAVYKYAKDGSNHLKSFTEFGYETERMETALVQDAAAYVNDQSGRFDSSSYPYNLGMIPGVPTTVTYWSISNENVDQLWRQTENVDQRSKPYSMSGTDQRTITSTLLSSGYFIDKENRAQYLPYGYELVEKTESGNCLYRNLYALPWGYTYDSSLTYVGAESLDGLEKEQAMLQSIILDEPVDGIPQGEIVYAHQEIPVEVTNLENVVWDEDKTLRVEKDNGVITLEFHLPERTEGYLRLENLDLDGSGNNDFQFTVNCGNIEKSAYAESENYTWYFGRKNFLFHFEYSEEARTSCRIKFPEKGTYHLDGIRLFALPMENYPGQVEALRAEPLENIEFGVNRVTGTVDLSSKKVLALSLPYSAGWTATVDGQPAKLMRGNYMFIALPLEAGHHEIEFRYCTPGIKAGLGLTVVSVIAVLAMFLLGKRKRAA